MNSNLLSFFNFQGIHWINTSYMWGIYLIKPNIYIVKISLILPLHPDPESKKNENVLFL